MERKGILLLPCIDSERVQSGFPDCSRVACCTELGLRGQTRLREELRADAHQRVDGASRIVRARIRSSTLALRGVELAVDLLDLLRERITEEILLQLRDGLNRLRALAGAVGGAGGVSGVAVLAHANIIARGGKRIKPLDQQNCTIS